MARSASALRKRLTTSLEFSGSPGYNRFVPQKVARCLITCAAQNVRAARHFLREHASAWHVVEDGRLDDLVLLGSELVSNAVSYARSDVEIVLAYDPGCLRLEVHDEDTRVPGVAAPDTEAMGGRGLTVVAHLADVWGIERTPTGKCVWVEIDVPNAA